MGKTLAIAFALAARLVLADQIVDQTVIALEGSLAECTSDASRLSRVIEACERVLDREPTSPSRQGLLDATRQLRFERDAIALSCEEQRRFLGWARQVQAGCSTPCDELRERVVVYVGMAEQGWLAAMRASYARAKERATVAQRAINLIEKQRPAAPSSMGVAPSPAEPPTVELPRHLRDLIETTAAAFRLEPSERALILPCTPDDGAACRKLEAMLRHHASLASEPEGAVWNRLADEAHAMPESRDLPPPPPLAVPDSERPPWDQGPPTLARWLAQAPWELNRSAQLGRAWVGCKEHQVPELCEVATEPFAANAREVARESWCALPGTRDCTSSGATAPPPLLESECKKGDAKRCRQHALRLLETMDSTKRNAAKRSFAEACRLQDTTSCENADAAIACTLGRRTEVCIDRGTALLGREPPPAFVDLFLSVACHRGERSACSRLATSGRFDELEALELPALEAACRRNDALACEYAARKREGRQEGSGLALARQACRLGAPDACTDEGHHPLLGPYVSLEASCDRLSAGCFQTLTVLEQTRPDEAFSRAKAVCLAGHSEGCTFLGLHFDPTRPAPPWFEAHSIGVEHRREIAARVSISRGKRAEAAAAVERDFQRGIDGLDEDWCRAAAAADPPNRLLEHLTQTCCAGATTVCCPTLRRALDLDAALRERVKDTRWREVSRLRAECQLEP